MQFARVVQGAQNATVIRMDGRYMTQIRLEH